MFHHISFFSVSCVFWFLVQWSRNSWTLRKRKSVEGCTAETVVVDQMEEVWEVESLLMNNALLWKPVFMLRGHRMELCGHQFQRSLAWPASEMFGHDERLVLRNSKCKRCKNPFPPVYQILPKTEMFTPRLYLSY